MIELDDKETLENERKVYVGSVYYHFKGGLYRVLNIATDCETLKQKVVYRDEECKSKIWVRDMDEFLSKVDKEKYPDSNMAYRFTMVKDRNWMYFNDVTLKELRGGIKIWPYPML